MIRSLGLVVTLASGTPVRATFNQADPAKRQPAQSIKFSARKGNTGLVFIGLKGMDKASGVNVVGVVGIPPATGDWPELNIEMPVIPNGLDASVFYVDADQANDGVYVSYTQG